jgi:hypothetical protein
MAIHDIYLKESGYEMLQHFLLRSSSGAKRHLAASPFWKENKTELAFALPE